MNELTPDERKILVDAIQDSATVVHKGRKDMNERIRQLAEQAKQSALDAMIKITDREQALKVYSESYDTEFAELIVQECVRKVRNRGGMCGALASNWIEEHFYGVEE
jgi:vacuolar-type H+-ATPase subunit H